VLEFFMTLIVEITYVDPISYLRIESSLL